MNEARNSGHFCAETVPSDRTRLESLLRIALEQYPHKSPEDQAHERRFMSRDLADFLRVIERIAAAQSSDPMTDDLTVPLAIELAEKDATIAALVKALEDVKQKTQISGL